MQPPTQFPMCVRCLRRRKDARLRHFFLCHRCTAEWKTEAFDRNKPLYEGERLGGYCQHCNAVRKNVRLRTWFLCDICDRVARSIGRNHVAEQAIMEFWRSDVQSQYPKLELIQNDPSSLRPRRTTDTTGLAPLDFIAVDSTTKREVFGIENKTGRSAVRGTVSMSQFQLDISDCDSILNDMRQRGIPAYIIHAQVLETWMPPTMGYYVAGLWWSDVYSMSAHSKHVRKRQDEQRGAAYFGKRAFEPIETFAAALAGERDFALLERFRKEGVPRMYTLP